MDCCYLPGIMLKSSKVHTVSQKGYAFRSKTTFVRIQLEINPFEFLKNQSDVT
jgi:hypothetical protein